MEEAPKTDAREVTEIGTEAREVTETGTETREVTETGTEARDMGASAKTFETLKNEIEDVCLNLEQVQLIGAQVNNIVLEGGGIRGIAFGGAIQFLEEFNLLSSINGFAGSSAGAIVAAGLSVGYTAKEIIEVLTETDFNAFKDDSTFVLLDLIRLVSKYGIYKGDAFFKWITDILARKTGNGKITFQQVFERYGKRLVITGSCVNRAQTYYFNHEDPKYAQMPVALAVRISMSIPIYWKAVNLGEDYLVDGGVLNNYPLFVFDGKFIGDTEISDAQIAASKTIGFKLMTSTEKRDSLLYHVNEKIEGPVDFTRALINAMLIQIERGHIRQGYWQRTVCINTHDVSSLDFALNAEAKKILVHEGYIAAKNFFHCKIAGLDNEMNRKIARY
jgi:NTE family protein